MRFGQDNGGPTADITLHVLVTGRHVRSPAGS